MKIKYYNYRRTEAQCDEGVIFCVDNMYDSRHYGNIQRIFECDTAIIDAANDAEIIKIAAEYYKTTPAEARDMIAPKNIVESAGAWDDIEFINFLEFNNYFDNVSGIVTPDGAIFFDLNNLVSKKIINDDEAR